MKVEIKRPKKKEIVLATGDIVVTDFEKYLIIREKEGFIAKNFNGVNGATGHYATLTDLANSLTKYNYTHYSQKEFKLILEEITEDKNNSIF